MFAATSLCRRPGAAVSGRELSTRPRARASTACTRGARVQAVATATAADAPATAPSLPYRVGHGWDLHRLEEGYPLIIGGIDIPHVVGCVAHSDGARCPSRVLDSIVYRGFCAALTCVFDPRRRTASHRCGRCPWGTLPARHRYLQRPKYLDTSVCNDAVTARALGL